MSSTIALIAALLTVTATPSFDDPAAVAREMTRGGDSYAAAKQTLLKWLRADLHGEAGVEALIDVVHGVTAEADPILVTDVVEALAGEERMAQTLTRISKKKLRHGARDDALALALFKRAGGSQNPAYLTALLGYLGALQKRDGSPVGVGYDALVANFAEVERAREFMWDNRIPAPGTDRRQALIEALAGHPGDRLAASLESKSVAHRSLAIAVALKLDQPNAAVMDLAVQQALVTSLSAIVTRDLEHEGWLDPVAELAGQAWQRPAALLALVDAVLGRKGHAEAARDALLDLLTGRAVALDAARIEALVSLVTSADPVYGVFDLLEQLDLTPVVDRMVRLLSDDLRGIPAGYALIGRAPDALLQDLAGRLGSLDAAARVTLLTVLRDVYTGQVWAHQTLSLLEDEDDSVARAAMALLLDSQDVAVRTRLDQIDREAMVRLAAPYTAISGGLQVRFEPAAARVVRGAPLAATVEVVNAGRLPIVWPLAIDFRYSRWELAGSGSGLGPLPLSPAAGSAPAVLHPGKSASFTVDIGRALAALGTGAHRVRVQFTSRARHAQQRHAPDFTAPSASRPVVVEEPGNIRSWLTSPGGVQAWVESPGAEWRETGWKRWRDGYEAVAPTEDALHAVLAKAAKTGKLPRRAAFTVRVESQAAATEAFEIDDKGRFVHSVSVEGEAGLTELKLRAADRKAFFAALAAGRPFDHEPVQVLGALREAQVSVYLTVGDQTWRSPALWHTELTRHPALRPWFSQLLAWRDQAAQ